MSTKRLSPTLTLVALIGGSLFTAGLLLRRFWGRGRPGAQHLEERVPLNGLHRPVEIIRDRWGVPHIYAASNTDLYFAQGFVHAQDRLFQLDTGRRLGWGRLSEILGPAGLPTDRMARILGWPQAIQAQVMGLQSDAQTQAIVEAYSAGINAFIERGRWPLPYRLLRFRPEPWQPADSLAWGIVLAWGLSGNWDMELIRSGLIAELGPEKAADLMPAFLPDYPTILPSIKVNGRVTQAIHQAFQQAAATMPEAPMPAGPMPGGRKAGSNNWVVNGSWTETGRPILANDPHLPPLFPAIWYENLLHGGDYHVTGFTTPGVPGVIIGHNQNIAWGVTNAFPDIQDLYTVRFHPHDPEQYAYEGGWRRARVVREEIQVRGRRKPHIENVCYTHHGPVISPLLEENSGRSRDIALRWSGHESGNHLQAVLGICRAENWAEFDQACTAWSFPSQNTIYADVAGNIGYIMPGRVPVRGSGDGLVPLSGDRPENEWTGWIPHDELPRRFNPPEGRIVTANNRVTGDEYPYLLTGDWLAPYRARRITELLAQYRPLTVQACRDIQLDTVSLLIRRFLLAALPPVQNNHRPGNRLLDEALLRLEQWQQPVQGAGYDMQAGAVGPSLAHIWLTTYMHMVMDQALGEGLAGRLLAPDKQPELGGSPFADMALELAISWLETGPPEWVGPVQPLLYPALAQAVELLAGHLGPDPAGWQWGRLHQIHWQPLLSRAAGLNRIWQPIIRPAGGDGFTVNQAEVAPLFPPPPVRIIVSCRMILDVGEWDRSLAALPGGQSEHLLSPHYQDGLVEWAQGNYHPLLFSRESVMAAATATTRLIPEDKWPVEQNPI